MRILLIQPPQGTRFGFSRILMVEPLGLECVGAALKLHDHEVELIDLRLDRLATLGATLASRRPTGVGISCGFTTDVYWTLRVARMVKEVLPATHLFVGGHHASLIPGDFLFPGSPVDAVVVGEGEWTTLELVDGLHRGTLPPRWPGWSLWTISAGGHASQLWAGPSTICRSPTGSSPAATAGGITTRSTRRRPVWRPLGAAPSIATSVASGSSISGGLGGARPRGSWRT